MKHFLSACHAIDSVPHRFLGLVKLLDLLLALLHLDSKLGYTVLAVLHGGPAAVASGPLRHPGRIQLPRRQQLLEIRL